MKILYKLHSCILCKKLFSGIICNICQQTFEIYNNYCPVCKSYEHDVNCVDIKTYIPYKYADKIVKLVLLFKYFDKYSLAYYFSQTITEKIDKTLNWIIVPIPSTRQKILQRGYNPAVLLANNISNLLAGSVVLYNILHKSKNINKLNKTRSERYINAQNIYIDNIHLISNKNILIVDDIIASGATIKRAIELLKPFALTIAVAAIAAT